MSKIIDWLGTSARVKKSYAPEPPSEVPKVSPPPPPPGASDDEGEAVGDCDNNPNFVPPPFEVDVLIEIRELLKCVLAELEK